MQTWLLTQLLVHFKYSIFIVPGNSLRSLGQKEKLGDVVLNLL